MTTDYEPTVLAEWCQAKADLPPCSHFGMNRELFRRIAALLRSLPAPPKYCSCSGPHCWQIFIPPPVQHCQVCGELRSPNEATQ